MITKLQDMIKTTELRIGNKVDIGPGYAAEVFEIGQDKCEISYDGASNGFTWFECQKLNPIPLTPEVLAKCGFEKGKAQSGGYYGYSNGRMEIDNKFQMWLYDGRIDDSSTKEYWPAMEYLHQLQNLYFALTGEELTITL